MGILLSFLRWVVDTIRGGPDSFGDIGFYWSCTPCSDSRTFVWYFRFHNYDKYGPIHFCARYFGQSVRLCKLETMA